MATAISNKPNLFDFATSELSQDAFICWLVSHVNCSQEPAMRRCARDFVATLYSLMPEHDRVDGSAVSEVKLIKQQYFKIDVYFQAIINDRVVSFIIEDKTHTTHHDDQLTRYKEAIEKDELKEDEYVLIYFKTGYLFREDHEVTKHGYHTLDLNTLVEFLDKHNGIDNAIFSDYYNYVRTLHTEISDAIRRLENEDDGYEQLANDYCQWKFAESLRQRCPEMIINADGFTEEQLFYRGSSFGAPWTQSCFVHFPQVLDGVPEWIFYRIDSRRKNAQNAYYLCPRQYGDVKGKPEAERIKIERLSKYRRLFESAVQASQTGLLFAAPSNRGVNESEIGILFFDGERNTIGRVLNEFSKVHRAFVEEIRRSDLS